MLIFAAVLAIIPSFRSQLSALALLIPFMLVIYVPLGYYTDRWIYRKRQQKRSHHDSSRVNFSACSVSYPGLH